MTTSAFYLLNERIATDKYNLNTQLSDLFSSWQYEHNIKNYLFLVCDGDCEIDGHFWLDYEDHAWATDALDWRKSLNIMDGEHMDKHFGVTGVVITGNLTVKGSIINSNSNGGPFLLVMGDVSARNLVAGGAFMRIKGNAQVSGVTYGHYNDGSIWIDGALTTTVFINSDHDFSYGDSSNMQVNLNDMRYDGATDFDEPQDEYQEQDEGVIPTKLQPLLGTDVLVWDDILSTLCQGGEVLKAQGATSTKKDDAYWQTLIKTDAYNIAKIPKSDLTLELSCMAVAQNGRVLEYVPEVFKTAEVCAMAMTNDGYALKYVPEHLKTKALCSQAVKHGGYLRYVPPHFIDHEMALEAAKKDSEVLYYIPADMIDMPIMINYMQHVGDSGYSLQTFFKTPRAFTAEDVVLALVPMSYEQFSNIPAMYVTEKVFKLAESLYGQHEGWLSLCHQHSKAAYGGNLTQAELQSLIDGDYINNMDEVRYKVDDALSNVWGYQVDSQYILKLMEVGYHFQGAANIPHHLMNEPVIEALLSKSYTHIQYLPHDKITNALCLRVVNDWHTNLSCIPETFRTIEVCKAALDKCKRGHDYLLEDVLLAIPADVKLALGLSQPS